MEACSHLQAALNHPHPPKTNRKHIKILKMNTFMKLLKVLVEENENGGWEGKKEDLLPQKQNYIQYDLYNHLVN